MVAQLAPADFQAWLAQASPAPVVLDVREPWELALASVRPEGFELRAIPMGDIPARLQELPDDAPIVCLCHHGMRSMQVAVFLQRQGFENVLNLQGGIDAWSRELDAAVPRY